MVNPRTVNAGIIVPLTGADVDLWGEVDVNPNMVAVDGFIGGVQTVAVSNAPVTLSSPAGFVATPTPGPTQSQNRVLRFTGVLASDVRITLPLPGAYIVENLTTGANILEFQGVTATEVLAIDQGEIREIYNDGTNVRFVDMGHVGQLEFWGGVSAMPAWVAHCTKRPYLLADGTVYNFSDFPYLAARYLAKFGGNGVTTFGVQDLRGRVPLAYDGTGTRITTPGCGIDGQTIGSAGGQQSSQLVTSNLPAYTPSGTVGAISVSSIRSDIALSGSSIGVAAGGNSIPVINGTSQIISQSGSPQFNGNPQGGNSVSFSNVLPAQVSGIWVVKT